MEKYLLHAYYKFRHLIGVKYTISVYNTGDFGLFVYWILDEVMEASKNRPFIPSYPPEHSSLIHSPHLAITEKKYNQII